MDDRELLHEYVIDCYQGIVTRSVSMRLKSGDVTESRKTMRIFRWVDGRLVKEGNATAFALHINAELGTNLDSLAIHLIVREYEGPMRDGTKGKGKGAHNRSAVAREEVIDVLDDEEMS